ncbi:hypothetical protein [Sphingomonas faeni]|uniref:hypothetical protein n=1 Tax=Sphingomonas faeni TaxID=185950 RepID=UPI00335FFA0C
MDEKTAAVHVELSFRSGRVGHDDPDFPFTFRIGLKRATLIVKVEEPLSIIKDSIARHIPKNQTERTTISTIRENIKKDSSLNGKVDAKSLAIAVAASKGSVREVTKEEQIKAVQSIPTIIVSSIPSAKGEYSWELTPGNGDMLMGQPWDPTLEPRLSVRNFIPDAKLDPTVKILITCAVEDIVIDELKPKSDGVLDRLKEILFNEINYKAAIQHLKVVLKHSDLEVSELDSQFSKVVIADVLAVTT